MTQAATFSTVGYVYDGDGHRVEKTASGSAYKLYWYDAGGNVLDETDQTGSTTNSSFNEYVFFGGARIARRDGSGNIYYYFGDHLGTARVMTNATGTVCYDADFYPFGGERAYTTSCNQNYKFTGQERDTESGLDHFPARNYASGTGRFMTPDPAGNFVADPANPQSWNMYAYARNNPLNLIDPTGLDVCYVYSADPNNGTSTYTANYSMSQDQCTGDNVFVPTVITQVTVSGDPSGGSGGNAGGGDGGGGDGDGGGGGGGGVGGGGGGIVGTSGKPQAPGSPQKPQTPWYNTCGAQATANFALHGGVDAIGLLPGIGDVSEAAIGALGLTAGYGVALMDAATPGGLTNGGVAMQGAGTALFVADASKTSIAAVTRIAATAKFIPFINKLYAAGSLIYDANRAYQAYQACTQAAQ